MSAVLNGHIQVIHNKTFSKQQKQKVLYETQCQINAHRQDQILTWAPKNNDAVCKSNVHMSKKVQSPVGQTALQIRPASCL